LFSKRTDRRFPKKLEMVKKELGNSVDLKIVNEGELINDNIELPAESSTNGVN
jgi:hypothetical protein